MNNFLLHIGPAEDYYYFWDKILKHHSVHEPDSYICILPVNRAVRRFKKDLVSRFDGTALIEPYIFTFDELFRYIQQRINGSVKVISPAQRRILITDFLRENGSSFKYFNKEHIQEEGLIRHIEQMLLDLGKFGYTAKKLEQRGETPSDKIHDFAFMLNGLHDKLGSSLTDEFLFTSSLLTHLDYNIFSKIFSGVKYLYLSGYGLYTPPMIQFLQIVKQWINVEVKIDYLPQNEELFAHTKPAFDILSGFAEKIIKHDTRNDLISGNLFLKDCPYKGNNKVQRVTMYHDKESEINGIAAEAKHLHDMENIPWHEIGVTFPELESYSPLIRTVFNSHKIPFNLSTGFPLAQSPLVQTIIKILQTICNSYTTDDMFDLLANPFIFKSQQINITTLRIAVGRGLIKHFNEAWDTSVENSDFPDEMRHDIVIFLEKLYSLAQPLSASSFYNAFYKMLRDIGLLTWYKKHNLHLNAHEIEKEYRAFNRFTKVFEQMIWFLSRYYSDSNIETGVYLSYLKSIVRDTQYHIREWSNYGVQIMPRLEIQSMKCRILFIGGMVEGKFPRSMHDFMFFNERERKQLGLFSFDDILNQDRYQFYQLLSSRVEKVILTMPLYENEHSNISSSFLTALNLDADLIQRKPVLSIREMSDIRLGSYFGHQLNSEPPAEVINRMREWAVTQSPRELNQWLNAIKIYQAKKKYKHFSMYEGNLTALEGVQSCLTEYLKKCTFSVTALEQYAFCPMQYFLNRLLRIQPDEIFDEGITAVVRGLLIHRVLYAFYSKIQSEGGGAKPWLYKDLLYELTEKMMDDIKHAGIAVTLEKERLLGSGPEPGLWDTFLEHEKQEMDRTGFTPFLFEWKFGEEIPFVLEGKNGLIYLTGVIDRIDKDKKGYYLVYDYKTGRTAQNIKIKQLVEGTSLQLPVYLAAVKKNIPQIYCPAGAAWFQVNDRENCGRIYVVSDEGCVPRLMPDEDGKLPNKKYNELTLSMLIERSLSRVIELVEEIITGQFRHTKHPRDKRCSSYCEFKMICRKDVNKLLYSGENE